MEDPKKVPVAEAQATSEQSEIAELKKKIEAQDAKILTMETSMANMQETAKVQAEESAEEKVQKAVDAGRIPPQNKELQGKWKNLILVDAKNAELLETLPVNPAYAKVIPGTRTVSAHQPAGESEFDVQAKSYGEANGIKNPVEASGRFARTPEGQELFKAQLQSIPTKR